MEMQSRTLLRAVIDTTGLSRRKAFAAIREGRVAVDDKLVLDPSSLYNGERLRLDGEDMVPKPAAKVYLLLNKPPGFITTVSDDRGRRTVLDLVPADLRAIGLHPIGRLDRDTSGLLILTNDGDLTYRLTHPKHEVEKEYWAGVSPSVPESALVSLRRGVEIDGAVRMPLRVERLADAPASHLAITLREGRRRQVRRMLDAVGLRVISLRRVREGGLRLENLAEGAVRLLTPSELRLLTANG
jgi:pseudouridine synthase